MSLSAPRLAWSVVLTPTQSAPLVPPPWPALITDLVPAFDSPKVDPVSHILHGPIATQALTRGEGPAGLRYVVAGVGRFVTLTLIDRVEGEIEGVLNLAPLRARLGSALLGVPVPARNAPPGQLGATPDRMGALLGELFEADPAWAFAGLVEVAGVLSEGVAGDLPATEGWAEHGDLRIGRATGIGAGHAAWKLTGHFTTATERDVADRRITVLMEGHLSRIPPFAQFGGHALFWGAAARSAMRLSSALAGILDEVRTAASWAVAGGPLPDGSAIDFDRLAGRLEVARVRLREEIGLLRRGKDQLVPSARRILGDAIDLSERGPFAEGSGRADALIAEIEGREVEAGRWADALAVARRASG